MLVLVEVIPIISPVFIFDSIFRRAVRFGLHIHELRPVHDRVLQPDSALVGAYHDAGAAVIAFARIGHHRGLAFFGVGKQYITLADIRAAVAAHADIFVKSQRSCAARNNCNGKLVHFFHYFLPPI